MHTCSGALQVREIAAEIGVRFVGLGSDPVSQPGDVAFMPKRRYRILDAYVASPDGLGRELCLSSTSTQVRAW